MLKISLLGKEYEVPEGITISEAFEYVGIKTSHGKGCLSGICGACAVLYRIDGESQIKACLSCQTKVKDGMRVSSLPGFTVEKSRYGGDTDTINELYPEINSCVGCGACTKLCPKGIDVKKFVEYAKNGEVSLAAKESFECVMCGACAEKCPASIKPYSVGMFERRLEASKTKLHLKTIEETVNALVDMSDEELKALYKRRM